MKKRSLALLGFAALAGLSLASCTKKPAETTDKTGETGSKDTGSSETSTPVAIDSSGLDIWLVYSKSYGTTYNGVIKSGGTTNPIDNITYKQDDLLPAWKEFAKKLNLKYIKQGAVYGASDGDNYKNFKAAKSGTTKGLYKDKNGQITDLFYNTTANLNELGDGGEVLDLSEYIDTTNPDKAKMPNFSKYLKENPAVEAELYHNDKIFYTPYLDGYQAIERMFVMDTASVAKLLDEELPAGTGELKAGASAEENSKGLKGAPSAVPFIDADKNYPDATTTIKIVDEATSAAVDVTVAQTDNIIKQQNEALAKTDGSTTGKTLIDQFKAYAMAAYGDIITNKYDGKISKMFTSVGACYNADDLVALLRLFKANPDVLYGSADAYDEVVPVFPRGQADNRVENILNFGATLYGVQGRGSEYDHLFFGADGKIHDFDTAQASYDMLDKLHALYSEGLIQANFWSGSKGTAGLDTFFKRSLDNSTFGLLEYDYTATQAAANDIKDGVGTKSESRKKAACGFDFSKTQVQGVAPILSPLTYVSTESFTYGQNLDDKTGKTLTRYYEENRSVKNTSWAIPAASDNKDDAIKLMDYMFSLEGWRIQNFGPEGYWDLGTVLGEDDTPIIKQSVLNHFAGTGLDFWNYCRGFLGTTQGIGHYRPTTLDFQACNFYARDGYTKLTLAADLGVQMNSRAVGNKADITWHASMPMAVFSLMSEEVSNTYLGVTTFWAQKGKASADGTKTGWVKIVADGSDTTENVLSGVGGKEYKYADVLAERVTKNTTYLNTMGKKMGLEAPESKAQ